MNFLSAMFLLGGVLFQNPEKEIVPRYSGQILDATTRAPIDSVRLLLAGSGQTAQTVTDKEGKFSFEKVLSGAYTLYGEKDGYCNLSVEQRRLPESTGIPLILAGSAGSSESVFLMLAGGAISGRVLDSRGDPVRGARALPFYMRYDDLGRLVPRYLDGADTDDRGEYLIQGLVSGVYGLRIIGTQNTDLFERPAAVTVEAGGIVKSPDAILLATQNGQLRLRLFDDSQPNRRPQSPVFLFQVLREGESMPIVSGTIPVTGESVGRLAFGNYEIRFRLPTSTSAAWGRTAVTLNRDDVLADLLLQRPSEISGRVLTKYASDPIGVPLAGLQTRFLDASALLDSAPGDTRPGKTSPDGFYSLPSKDDGTFVVAGVLPGLFRIDLLGLTPLQYVAEAEVNGQKLQRRLLQIESGGRHHELRFVIGERTAILRGSVESFVPSQTRGATIALIPDDRSQADLFVVVKSDGQGAFELNAVPGAFHLYAWTELPGAAYMNEEFMKPYDAHGLPIRLESGQNGAVRVRVLEVQ